LTRRIRGEAVLTNFLLTQDAARQPRRARYLGNKQSEWLDWQHDRISANALDLGQQGELIVASAPYGTPIESAQIETDAELAVVHLDARQRVKSWAMARGSRLLVAGKTLYLRWKREWMSG
jgi:hypothetical protein